MWQLVMLGVVQGVVEFLPISSKGHLFLLEYFLEGFDEDPLGVVVWLHLGTLGATCVVYRREGLAILRGDWRLAGMLAVAMLPAAVIGFTLRSRIEAAFFNIHAIGFLFWVTAAEIVTRVFREKAAAGPNPAPPCEASSFSPAAPSPAPAAPKPEIVIVPFVSETDVRVAITRQEKIYIGPKTIVTPSARDLASAHEVLVETELRPSHSTRVGTVDS